MNQKLERRTKWRFRFRLLLGLALLLGISYGFYQWRQFQYERELQTLLAQINADDPGWRWDETDTNLPSIPDDQNAAKRLIAISEQIGMKRTKGLSPWFLAYQTIAQKCDSSFEYIERNPAHRIPEILIATMRAHLTKTPGPEGLQQLRELRHLNLGRWPASDDQLLFNQRYQDWYLPFDANRLLFWDTEVQLDAQQTDMALKNVSTVLAMTRWFNRDPSPRLTLVINLVKTHGYADKGLQRIMGQSINLSEPQLLNLQSEFLRAEKEMVPLENLFRNLRAGIDHDLQLIQDGTVELSKEFQKTHIDWRSTGSPSLDSLLIRSAPTLMIASWCRPLPWALERAEALKYCSETIVWSRLPDHELLPHWRNWSEPVNRCPPFTSSIWLELSQKNYNEMDDHKARMYLPPFFERESGESNLCRGPGLRALSA
jgi:hypothetical protein